MNKHVGSRFNPAAVEMWIASELAANRLVNGVVEIRHAGKCVHTSAFGIANSHGEPATRDTVYWIASMTKPIVSVAAMRLIERGDLSLCDPVSNFIPGFGKNGVITSSGDVVPVTRPSTILDLFTHMSGVTYGLFGEGDIHRQYADAQVYDFRSDNVHMAERLAKLPLLHQPGTVFEYGMSTDILGRVIEVLTGLQLDDALKELVLGPLEMNDTAFLPEVEKFADIPASLIRDTVAPLISSEQTWWSGGAGLCSTVANYMRFARMLLNGGSLDSTQILRPETLALMCQDYLPENVGYGTYTAALGITAPWPENGLGFGLGFAVRTEVTEHLPGGIGEVLWPGVSGANFWVDPENDLIVVFLTHAPDHRATHRIELRNAIYAGLKEET